VVVIVIERKPLFTDAGQRCGLECDGIGAARRHIQPVLQAETPGSATRHNNDNTWKAVTGFADSGDRPHEDTMRLKSSSRIRMLVLLLSLGSTACLNLAAQTFDRLQAPGLSSQRASTALLLDIDKAAQRLVAVGEQGLVLLSDDQGARWRQAEVPVSVLLTAVDFVDARHGWAVGHDGVVLHTQDGGDSWNLQLDGNQINALRVAQLEAELAVLNRVAEADPLALERLEMALDDGRYAVDDGPTMPLLDVWFADRLRGYVLGAYGQLLQTRDGGNSWRSLGHTLPNPDRFHLNSLLKSAAGDLYIAGEAGLLLRSRDDGASWQALDSPYDGSLFALAEQDGLYVMGLRGHLFHSPDGDRWQSVELKSGATLNNALAVDAKLVLVGQGGLLLAGDRAGFAPLPQAGTRQSLSAAVVAGHQLVLVGEGGIQRKPLPEGMGQ
jgi:photosystem II stability/assembly factor-like uncharacterized protein